MATSEESIGDMLTKTGGIKFGTFVLTSGKESNYYVDIKEVMTSPENLKIVTDAIAEHLTGENIAGVELGAVPLVVAAAVKTGKNYLIIRKERKHGTRSLLIGKTEEGMSVDLIEDVVTTGNSILKAVNILREHGCTVNRCVCVVDREEGGSELLKENGVELLSLVRISNVLKK